jgi:hypothetical protein
MTVDARDHARWSLLRDHGAVERSIEFVRVRRAGDDSVVAVRFEDQAGRARRAMVGLLTVDGAWRGTGGFSDGLPAGGERACWSAGYWSHSGGRRLVIGFWVVHPAGASLRVTDLAGRVLEDTVENGVAVVVAADGDFDESRATVELLDAAGDVLVAGPVWPAPAR